MALVPSSCGRVAPVTPFATRMIMADEVRNCQNNIFERVLICTTGLPRAIFTVYYVKDDAKISGDKVVFFVL